MELLQRIISDAIEDFQFDFIDNFEAIDKDDFQIPTSEEETVDFVKNTEHSKDPSLRWASFSLWSESAANTWVLFLDLGCDCNMKSVHVVLQLNRNPDSNTEVVGPKQMHIVNNVEEWTVLANDALSACISRGMAYEEEEKQDLSDDNTENGSSSDMEI